VSRLQHRNNKGLVNPLIKTSKILLGTTRIDSYRPLALPGYVHRLYPRSYVPSASHYIHEGSPSVVGQRSQFESSETRDRGQRTRVGGGAKKVP